MRDLGISLAWLAGGAGVIVALLLVDRWHQRRAWRQADVRAREILERETVVGFVNRPRRRNRQ